jgi:hypothetical protein
MQIHLHEVKILQIHNARPLHATVLLAVRYSAELNKYILLVRVICEKYRFRGQSNVPRRLFASPLNRYFSQITLTNRIYAG